MKDLNTTTFIGRMTADADSKSTDSGSTITKFSIAVNDGYGEKEHTSFFNCICFGKLADIIQQYGSKGKQVLISGSAYQNTWSDKDSGAKRSAVEFRVNHFQMVGAKSEESSPQPEVNNKPFNDDDLPF